MSRGSASATTESWKLTAESILPTINAECGALTRSSSAPLPTVGEGEGDGNAMGWRRRGSIQDLDEDTLSMLKEYGYTAQSCPSGGKARNGAGQGAQSVWQEFGFGSFAEVAAQFQLSMRLLHPADQSMLPDVGA
uniref:Uncharacterized protein n=1 Tax=Hemiselmis andersenii TaxID=464988 RepID=A0A7S1EK22_HEMAN